jgi:RimJ/RimL family protein N-acetyltransferase
MSDTQARPVLRGARVFLRPAERSDIPTFVAWFSDADVVETLGSRAPMSLQGEQEWYDHLQAEQGKSRWHLVICLRATGEAIGTAGLESIDHVNGHAELGISIGDRARWDQGFGTEAMEVLLDFAFGELRLERVYLYVMSFNPRARHVYEKVGFQLEGTLRRALLRHGRFHDIELMAILRDEWLAQERQRSWEQV